MKGKEKRILHGVLPLMFLLGLMMIPGLLPESACAADGNLQKVDGVYQIEDYADLKAFASKVNSGEESDANAELMKNIVCSDEEWVPIGTGNSHAYTGHFDGNHKEIYGLSNEEGAGASSNYQGLFGCIGSGGEVKNASIVGGNVSGRTYVGGVAGYNDSGTITNCYYSGAVKVADSSRITAKAGEDLRIDDIQPSWSPVEQRLIIERGISMLVLHVSEMGRKAYQ